MDEFVIKLEKEKIYLDKLSYLSTETLGLDKSVSTFREGTYWRIRPTRYFEEEKRLVAQIISYSAFSAEFERQPRCPYDVQVLAVPSINTPNLLKCTERPPAPPPREVTKPVEWPLHRKKEPMVPESFQPTPTQRETFKPVKKVHRDIDCNIDVKIDHLHFDHGTIKSKAFITELGKKIKVRLAHESIHPQFSEIRDLIKRVIGKDSIDVKISLKTTEIEGGHIEKYQVIHAESSDLEKFSCKEIGVGLEHLRLDAYIDDMFTGQPEAHTNITRIDDLYKKLKTDTVSSGQFLNKIIDRSKIHSAHLRYLSERHLLDTFHLRIIEKPFSFLFLLDGKTRNHFVLEVHSEELATYVWHVDKDKVSLRKKYAEIDPIIKSFEQPNRQKYLRTKPVDFARIPHDYTEDKKGFERWKERLENVLD